QPAPDQGAEAVLQGAGRGPGPSHARLRASEELARARQGLHRPEVGDRAGAGPARPDEPGSRPLTGDLHRSFWLSPGPTTGGVALPDAERAPGSVVGPAPPVGRAEKGHAGGG